MSAPPDDALATAFKIFTASECMTGPGSLLLGVNLNVAGYDGPIL